MFYLRAVIDLFTGSGGSITWSDVDAYARRYEITGGQFEKLKQVVFEASSALRNELKRRNEEEAARAK